MLNNINKLHLKNCQKRTFYETIIYNQTLVEKHNFNKIEKNEKLERLHYFANNLQKMTDFGLIHGDIKRSNVVFDGI